MSYQFTCIINGDSIVLDKMQAGTKLSELLTAIQRKSGIPPSRQELMTESANISTNDTNQTLLQLHLSNNCVIIVLDKDPNGDLEILPSPKHNQSQNDENADNNSNLLRFVFI